MYFIVPQVRQHSGFVVVLPRTHQCAGEVSLYLLRKKYLPNNPGAYTVYTITVGGKWEI
jgi:hypothetical protein